MAEIGLGQARRPLPRCREYGLRVVVDLHSPPGGQATGGGYAGSDHGLFTDAVCQRKFVDLWQRMARKYRGVEGIWGFDLANEPVEGVVADGLADWQELAERAARAIRAVDPKRTIIVEPAEGGGPRGLAELQPLDLPNVVYSVHMYEPTAFTHQGVFSKQRPVRYPGEIEEVQWGKAQLQAVLQPAIDFQKAYGVPMYIGEFSAIRSAPTERLPVSQGRDRNLRGPRLGLELPRFSGVGRLRVWNMDPIRGTMPARRRRPSGKGSCEPGLRRISRRTLEDDFMKRLIQAFIWWVTELSFTAVIG